MMDKIWGQACAELEQSVGPNNYNHWIKPLRLMAIDDGAARFVSPTRFISDWVGRHFAKDIMAVLTRHGAPVERLRFDVGSAAARPSAQATAPAGQLAEAPTTRAARTCLLYTSPSPRD